MHPSSVPDCNNGGVTQSSLNLGKSYTNMCRWNGCHKFQRLDIDARLSFSGFTEVGASHILKSWSYESPKQTYFRLKLIINKSGKPSIGPTWRHNGSIGERYGLLLHFWSSPFLLRRGRMGGGGSGYTLCTGDVPPSRVCFSQFLPGKGVVFRPKSLARGVFWSRFDTTRSFCK